MGSYRVVPDDNMWVVQKGGRQKSRHRKKSRAVAAARSSADSGDRLIVQRSDGTIGKNNRVR